MNEVPADRAGEQDPRWRGLLRPLTWAGTWVRRAATLALIVAAAGTVAFALAVWPLPPGQRVALTALGALPALAAFDVRRRIAWFVASLPGILDALAEVTTHPSEQVGEVLGASRRGVGAQVDRLRADAGSGRPRAVRALWRLVQIVRSPARELGRTTGGHLGEGTGTVVATFTATAARVIGLKLLTLVAAAGTVAVWIAVPVVAVVAR